MYGAAYYKKSERKYVMKLFISEERVRNIIEQIIWWAMIVLEFIIMGRIFDFTYYDMPGWGLIVWCWYILYRKRTEIDVRAVLLFTAFTIYMLVYRHFIPVHDRWYKGMALDTGLAYIMGKILIDKDDAEGCTRQLFIVIWVSVLGTYMHAIANGYVYFKEAGDVTNGIRYWNDFWSGAYIPATQHVMYSMLMASFIIPSFFFGKWWLPVITVPLGMIGLWFNIFSGSRMIVGTTAVGIIAEFVVFCIVYRRKKWARILMGCTVGGGVLLLAVFLIVCKLNIGNIQNSSMYYFLFLRQGGIFKNVRLEYHAQAFSQLIQLWYGGRFMKFDNRYIHNTWLDMYNGGGVVPTVLFLVFSILSIVDVVKLIRLKNVKEAYKIAVSGIWATYIGYYYFEPAIDANIMHVAYWTLLAGALHKYVVTMGRSVQSERGEAVKQA